MTSPRTHFTRMDESNRAQFSEWDQQAFEPRYTVLPLSEFEPLVRQYFSAFRV